MKLSKILYSIMLNLWLGILVTIVLIYFIDTRLYKRSVWERFTNVVPAEIERKNEVMLQNIRNTMQMHFNKLRQKEPAPWNKRD